MLTYLFPFPWWTKEHGKRNDKNPAEEPDSTQVIDIDRNINQAVTISSPNIDSELIIRSRVIVNNGNVDFNVDKRYKDLQLLGAGAFGTVACAVDSMSKSKCRVALKKIQNPFF